MIYLEDTGIAKRWKKLFEECSGLKVKSLEPSHYSVSGMLPCAKPCERKQAPCSLSLADMLAKPFRGFYLYPCPSGYSLAYVPVYAAGQLVSIFLVHGSKNDSRGKERFSSFVRFFSEIMNYLFRAEHLPGLSLVNGTKHPQDILQTVMHSLHKNYYRNNLSLKAVAREHNVSYYHLSHLFKKHNGTSFIKYLTGIRIEKAIKLLKNPKLTVFQVAYAVGYEDAGYFCKVFKEYTKLSPGAYRKRFFLRVQPALARQANL